MEAAQKHTPEPWTLGKEHGEYIITAGEVTVLGTSEWLTLKPEDACLIVTSPKLLRVLKAIVNQIDQGGLTGKVFARDCCIQDARALIAEAEGRA